MEKKQQKKNTTSVKYYQSKHFPPSCDKQQIPSCGKRRTLLCIYGGQNDEPDERKTQTIRSLLTQSIHGEYFGDQMIAMA